MTGRIVGDESNHDSLRGGPDSGYGVSEWVGPLSGLPFNHGLTLARRPRFSTRSSLTHRLTAARTGSRCPSPTF